MQRPTPMTVEAMQRIVNSFKQFEKKIDKLQDDISFHSQALMELRVMLSNMSGGPTGPDGIDDDAKVTAKKPAGIQHEHHLDLARSKGKNHIQPTPKKINKAKSLEPMMARTPMSPKKALAGNNSLRLKVNVPGKTTLRINKKPEKLAKIKKRNKSQ